MTTAVDLFNKAISCMKTDPPLAYRLLISAAQADPMLGEAWYNIAVIQSGNNMIHAAIASWTRALACDLPEERRVGCMIDIGHRLFHLGRLQEGWDWTQKALKANPDHAYPWENLSAICIQRGQTEDAVKYARKGFNLSQEPVTEVQLALALLNNGEIVEGLKHFEARFPYGIQDMQKFPYPRWDGAPVRRLLIVAEQGLGDTLSFCRFIPWAARRADEVVLSVQADLVRLLMPSVPSNVTFADPVHKQLFPEADCWCPIMSLPIALGMDDKHILSCSDLNYPVELAPRNASRPFRVGLSWAGSASNQKDQWRSIPVALLLELTAIPGTEWWSLQADGRAEELKQHGGDALVRDATPFLRDAALTAELMASELDLVITVDTFLCHLAGSVGRECWVMVASNAGDWRLKRRGVHAIDWYPNHRVFRQGPDATWMPVIHEVANKLRARVGVSARL